MVEFEMARREGFAREQSSLCEPTSAQSRTGRLRHSMAQFEWHAGRDSTRRCAPESNPRRRSQESCVFFEDHAIFDDEEVQIQDTDGGKRIAAAMGSHRAVILRNHGLLTATDRVQETVGLFVELERVAEVHMKARHAKPISAEAARYAKEDLTSFGPGRVVFASLVARHIDDPAVVLD